MQHHAHLFIIVYCIIAAQQCTAMHRTLLSHDCEKPLSHKATRWHKNRTPAPVSSHPTQDEVLFPSGKHKLSIQQLKPHPLTKQHLCIDSLWSTSTEKLLNDSNEEIKINSGEYNPEGTMIAIHYNNNKYFMYNFTNNDSWAYELSADNKKYVELAFHPHNCLVALLSMNKHNHPADVIHYWDYKSRTLVATTHPLRNNKVWPPVYTLPKKKLFFFKDGKTLACSIYNVWDNLATPCTNLFFIWMVFNKIKILPTELVTTIIQNIIDSMTNKEKLSYINVVALSRVAPLVIPQTTGDKIEPMNHETICKTITIVPCAINILLHDIT